MIPNRAVYPVTNEIVHWLHHSNLFPLEESVFLYFRTLAAVTTVIKRVEAGLLPKYAAMSALREYNERNRTRVTYEDVRDKVFANQFSDIGEWAAYTENPKTLLDAPLGNPEDLLLHAPTSLQWVVTWYPMQNTVVVFRSPHLGYRQPLRLQEDGMGLQNLFAEGLQKGSLLSYVLPPEVEAALGWLSDEELDREYSTHSGMYDR